MTLTKAEKAKLKKEQRQKERAAQRQSSKKKNLVRNVVISAVIVLAIAYGVFSYISEASKPGYYDDFAKCLTEKGMVIYGAEWCSYTEGQKLMFGKSAEHLNYQDYSTTTGVTTTPTWELNGERYPRAQTLEKLSEISGCELPQ